MLGDYTCNYLHNSGEVCGQGCRRPEGCFDHWKSKKCVHCKVCGKSTSSELGLCRAHIKGYCVMKCLYSGFQNKRTTIKLINFYVIFKVFIIFCLLKIFLLINLTQIVCRKSIHMI